METRVVDNRVFLLGLDELYREAMKVQERGELLRHARDLAKRLQIAPANAPIEGYYSEDDKLTEYFRLMRGLQAVDDERSNEVNRMDAYKRLFAVTSSALFGEPTDVGRLFPVGSDALTAALQTKPWTVPALTAAAQRIAVMSNDCGLVTLAAFPGDPVVLAALRESVVLYAMFGKLSGMEVEPPRYDWQVDPELAERAERFVATFNELFPHGPALPEPTASNAEQFWVGKDASRITGRCVRIGQDESQPPRYYHWGIRIVGSFTGPLEVDDFWSHEVWTTERYRRERLNVPSDHGLTGLQGMRELEL